jgi:phage terminase large subunit-like protein
VSTPIINREALIEEILLREEIERRHRENKLQAYYPETGPLRRERYVKHMEFFEKGATKNERLFMAANRVGKTEGVGAYEASLHLTGLYPPWWKGRKFTHAISAWAAGQTSRTVRDIVQLALLGPAPLFGTGMIPRHTILGTTPKPGVPEAIESIYVKHVSGARSEISLKSYDQGVESFYGTGKDLIWLDEEAEQRIYVECLTRTLSTVPGQPNGSVLFTFTPLEGMTDIVRQFLEAPQDGPKCLVSATWDDAPHLGPRTRAELFASIPAYQRDARTKGIPQLGSGAIYQVDDADILVKPFAIPDHWPRAYGLDVGWNRTAAIWGALERESETIYLYSEHYRAHDEPSVHAQAIKARGESIPGYIDPAAKGRSQVDGRKLIVLYRQAGLNVFPAVNAVEAGIYACFQRMCSGRLKAFTSLSNWYKELRLYRRDENGKVVKQEDHAMDAMRYLVMAGAGSFKMKVTRDSEQAAKNHAEIARYRGIVWS